MPWAYLPGLKNAAFLALTALVITYTVRALATCRLCCFSSSFRGAEHTSHSPLQAHQRCAALQGPDQGTDRWRAAVHAQGEWQRRLMTAQSQEAWDAWSSYTVELRVVRAAFPAIPPCQRI